MTRDLEWRYSRNQLRHTGFVRFHPFFEDREFWITSVMPPGTLSRVVASAREGYSLELLDCNNGDNIEVIDTGSSVKLLKQKAQDYFNDRSP